MLPAKEEHSQNEQENEEEEDDALQDEEQNTSSLCYSTVAVNLEKKKTIYTIPYKKRGNTSFCRLTLFAVCFHTRDEVDEWIVSSATVSCGCDVSSLALQSRST